MITEIQRERFATDPDLAGLLDDLPAEQMTAAWYLAITRPPLATYRVLVGVDADGQVIGFAAIGPSEDADADPSDGLVAEFGVRPTRAGQGHEDRLMHAIADTLRADGFTRATWWINSDDDRLRALLTDSGWQPDGAHHEIGDDAGRVRIKQVRLHTALG